MPGGALGPHRTLVRSSGAEHRSYSHVTWEEPRLTEVEGLAHTAQLDWQSLVWSEGKSLALRLQPL